MGTTKMGSVENYAAKRTAELISQQITAAIADIPEPTTTVVTKTVEASASDDTKEMDEDPAILTNASKVEYKDDSDIDPVCIASLVIGLCALIVGIANMVYMSRSKSSDDGVMM